ncbi:RDD family protein [Mycobacterium sp. smrl_JER01]|uniref:RDD family protein n=1 Tax=Mycobacterium sp. smrl_JER01 TaxID=3402633 RepID=UPI003AC46732
MTGQPPSHNPVPPRRVYASWWVRVAAGSVDAVPLVVGWGIWEAWAISSASLHCTTHDNGGVSCSALPSPVADLTFALMVTLTCGYVLWNHGYRQGVRGSSIGKSLLRVRVVDERHWQPLGFSASVLRQVLHLIDVVVCFVGFLFPLWDTRRQTLADKLMGTVCVPQVHS